MTNDISGIAAGSPLRGQPAAERPDIARRDAAAPRTAGDRAVTVELSTRGEGAPIDSDRVADIRRAIERGAYPIVPAKIADAIIAAPFLLQAEQ